MRRESYLQSLLVATCLCIVCSVLVSTAAVTLASPRKVTWVRPYRSPTGPGITRAHGPSCSGSTRDSETIPRWRDS